MPSSESSIISAQILKRSIGGLGFLVRERKSELPVVITDIIQGGSAYDSGIVEVGDVVLKVNSTSLAKFPYQDALYALRAVKPGEVATLLLKVRDGYNTRLETTFDSLGNPKTVRITEPIHPKSKVKRKGNGTSTFDENQNRIQDQTQKDGVISDIVPFKRSSESDTGLSCSCLPTGLTVSSAAPITAPPRRIQDAKNVVQVVNGNSTSAISMGNGNEETHQSTPQKNTVNGTESGGNEKAEDTVDATLVSKQPIATDPLITYDTSRPKKSPQLAPGMSITEEPPSYYALKNWETGERINDNLYSKAMATTGCTRHKCIGSVMNPDFMTTDPRKNTKTKEEKLHLASDFIKQYYGSMKRKNLDMERKRLAEVADSIEKTGTYKLTEYELIFGAKTAWRNAPRCIGRIQWNKLQVFDYRHVENTAQMFDAICNHLKYATNKGNIRSCITFFPQRTDYKKDFRVWTSQFIRYAGYRQSDGSIVGDPANVEFTDLCITLGWEPKGGRFDILPLVLQANGEDPDWYQLPNELALEVKLRHPRFPWFEKLGYKWCAVPAVSNILLDIGGIEFPAAPFNGWFMGTEVARDLCDASRYDVLEEVALKMNLDTKNSSSLWKDSAMVEVNIAVLHSFQADRVTVMDHHSATQSFMKHFHNEMKTRRGCPGDWVWLTPPISGSLTPIFHQEILNYSLNPSCQYQPDPWKYHAWKGKKLSKLKKAIKFKELAKSVLIMSSMMGKAMANRVKATILYATETGKSLEYAKTLRDIFNHAFSAKVVCMDDYDVGNLEHETLLLVVTSTFGNGDPPENGVSLAQSLVELTKSEDENVNNQEIRTRFTSIHNVSKRVQRQSSCLSMTQADTAGITEAAGFLSNLRFSVFGLGSRAYPHFCAFAHAIDTLLGELQGERLLEIGEGDELCGQEESFRTWAKEVFKVACETFCVGEDVSSEAASASLMGQDRSWSPSKFRVSSDVDGVEETEISEGLAKFHKKDISICTMIKRKNMQSGKDNNRETILVELDASETTGINYQAGDHVGIYPCNQPEIVERVMARLADTVEPDSPMQLQMFEQRTTPLGVVSNWVPDKRLPICSLATAFERYLDITTCPSPLLLKLFADCASDDKEKARLLELSEVYIESIDGTTCKMRSQFTCYLCFDERDNVYSCRKCEAAKLREDAVAFRIIDLDYRTQVHGCLRAACLEKGNEEYEEWKFHHLPNLPEVLDEFPSVKVEASLLLSQLPPLQYRYYSISSSPSVHHGQVHCTVAVVSYKTQGGTGPTHHGVCSTYLNQLEPGSEVFCFIRPAVDFHLPEDASIPVLLIGPGTGIAPFRSFWEQRMYDIGQGKICGDMALLFGCRHPEQDHLYKEEIEEAKKCGAITRYETAFSRLPGKPKQYVQHVLKNNLADLANHWLMEKNGHIYICGDVTMADDVNTALIEVLAMKGGLHKLVARDHITKMKDEQRFHEDIFGVTLRTYEVNKSVRQKHISLKNQK